MKAKFTPRDRDRGVEDAGNQNEDRRGTKTNVGQVGKTTSEEKTDTKTKVEEKRTQGTALSVGSYVQGPCETRGYPSFTRTLDI